MNWDLLRKDKAIPEAVTEYAEKKAITVGPRYCKWLEWYKGELLIRTFAFKRVRKTDEVELTEVERAVPGDEYSLQKNIYLTAMSGYRPVFRMKEVSSQSWYGYSYYYFRKEDFDVWGTNKAMPGYMGDILNLQELFKNKYKYCGFSGEQGLKEYLEFYNEDPGVEFFGKLGLKYSKQLGKDAKADKKFRKFLAENSKNVNLYGYKVTRLAYKNDISFKDAENMWEQIVEAQQMFKGCAKTSYKVDKVKILKWVNKTLGYNRKSYEDYWNACVALGLDMRDTKNSMPNDFKRMHDIRIDEHISLKLEQDEKKNKEFNKKLKEVAKKYEMIIPSEKFLLILPTSKGEFMREGDFLHHCVGKMGYDVKMHDEKILIGFIRLKDEPNIPYVTAEYDLQKNKILQMHGDYNCQPDKDTEEFISKWAKALKRKKVTA